jgi:hypothetical protein
VRITHAGSAPARSSHKSTRIATLAALTLGLAPAVAQAQIVVGGGIGGVRIGQTQAQVRQALGAPHQLYCWSGTGPSCRWQEANYLQPTKGPSPVAQVLFSKSGRVVDILTSQGNQRTRGGIRVGSTRAQVRRAYPRAACAAQECVLAARSAHSAVVTTFFLSGRTVAAIEVAQADSMTLTLSPRSLRALTPASSPGQSTTTAIITLTDSAGDPEIGAVPQLIVTASAGNRIGSITPLGGFNTGRYSVQVIASSHRGPVTITATFHWGPAALRRVLGISASMVLEQL